MSTQRKKFKTPQEKLENEKNKQPDLDTFKITLLGLPGVGKTALCSQVVNRWFPEVHQHSTEPDSYLTHIAVTATDTTKPLRISTTKKGGVRVVSNMHACDR